MLFLAPYATPPFVYIDHHAEKCAAAREEEISGSFDIFKPSDAWVTSENETSQFKMHPERVYHPVRAPVPGPSYASITIPSDGV